MTNLLAVAVASWYCHCHKCNGVAYQPTASGAWPREGITVAAPRSIPFGTRVWIEGIGWRIVQDRTAKRFEGRWDVFISSHARAKKLGIKKARIYAN